MRAVIQRVSEASVAVDGAEMGRIGAGLLALVAVGQTDTESDAEELARKIIHLRIFADEDGRMNLDLLQSGGALCVVSQFTLYGDVRKGRRPFFGDAAEPERAEPLIDRVIRVAQDAGIPTATGRFQAQMAVSLVNDGPVTILLDTQKTF